jgi:hypothetical protein
MSLNKFTNAAIGKQLKLEIGCETLDCGSMTCNNIIMPVGADIKAHDITVDNDLIVNGKTDIGGNNYLTPNLGLNNYSLHTDGVGNTFWSPDDTGSGELTYNGTPPTVINQFVKFSSVDGKLVNQSLITDNGSDLNLNNQNITNVNLVDGESVPLLRTDINTNTTDILDKLNTTTFNNLIDQSVKIASNVEFNNITSKNLDLIHTVPRVNFFDQTETKKYTIELAASGQLQINNGAAQSQIRIRDNIAAEFPILVEAKGGIKTDVINEAVLNAGVTVEGVLLKDTAVQCGGLGIGEFPTANISIKAPVGQDALIKLDTTDAQNSGIQFNNEGVKQWVIENRDDNVFSITKADSSDVVKIGQNAAISLIIPSLTLGTSGQDFIINEGRGTAGQVLTTDGVGNTSWSGSSYGFQYFNDNTTVTSIANQGTFYSVEGARVAGLLQDFTSGATGLTYTGAKTKVYKMNLSLTWDLDEGKEDVCELAIFKNSVIVLGTKQKGYNYKDYPRNCSTNALISLSTNDIIDVRVADTEDDNDMLINNFSFTVCSV